MIRRIFTTTYTLEEDTEVAIRIAVDRIEEFLIWQMSADNVDTKAQADA